MTRSYLPGGWILDTLPESVDPGDLDELAAFMRADSLPDRWRREGMLGLMAWVMVPFMDEHRMVAIQPEKVGENTTAQLSRVLRLFVKRTHASAVILTMESWFMKMADPEGIGAHKQRAKLPKSLADAAGRQEALFMGLEKSDGSRRIWMAEIKRDPDKLEEWKESAMPEAYGKLVGFFSEGVA